MNVLTDEWREWIVSKGDRLREEGKTPENVARYLAEVNFAEILEVVEDPERATREISALLLREDLDRVIFGTGDVLEDGHRESVLFRIAHPAGHEFLISLRDRFVRWLNTPAEERRYDFPFSPKQFAGASKYY